LDPFAPIVAAEVRRCVSFLSLLNSRSDDERLAEEKICPEWPGISVQISLGGLALKASENVGRRGWYVDRDDDYVEEPEGRDPDPREEGAVLRPREAPGGVPEARSPLGTLPLLSL